MRASVLVVGDDPVQCAIIRQALAAKPYDCDQASDGVAALTHMEAAPADLVIIDMPAPGGEGIETILAIHRRWPASRIIAVSTASGLGKNDLLDVARSLGAHAALRKPIFRADIIALVEDLLGDGAADCGRD